MSVKVPLKTKIDLRISEVETGIEIERRMLQTERAGASSRSHASSDDVLEVLEDELNWLRAIQKELEEVT